MIGRATLVLAALLGLAFGCDDAGGGDPPVPATLDR